MFANVSWGRVSDVPNSAFIWPVTVQPDDIDAQGHASNVSVVQWMNHAAWEHSKALGWDVEGYRRLGGWFVVRRHEIDYHRPSLAGDLLHCVTWPCGLGKAVAERRHRIVRVADGALVAEGLNIWAYIDAATGRPKRIPDELRDAFDPAKFT
jgi:acyl-CoA thioester hydrolase